METARLEHLYKEQNLTGTEIAEIADVHATTVYRWLKQAGINTKKDYSKSSSDTKVTHYYSKYEFVECWRSGRARVHSLVAIAKGCDPYKVFSDEYNIHHKDGCKWNNSTQNIKLLTNSKHTELHHKNNDLASGHTTPENQYE